MKEVLQRMVWVLVFLVSGQQLACRRASAATMSEMSPVTESMSSSSSCDEAEAPRKKTLSVSAPERMYVPAYGVQGQRVHLATFFVANDGAQSEPVTEFTLRSTAGKEAFSRLGTSWDGSDDVFNWSEPDEEGTVTFYPNGDGSTVAAHASKTLQIYGILGSVGSSNADVKKLGSGERVAVELVSLEGEKGHEAVLASSLLGESVAVYASLPSVTVHPVPSQLVEDKASLFSWSVRATPSGHLSVKQFGLHVDVREVKLCNFRLQRDGETFRSTESNLLALDAKRTDLGDGCLEGSTDILLTFTREQIVSSEAGTEFTLSAQMFPQTLESFVRVSFQFLGDTRTSTLMCSTRSGLRVGTASKAPSILWSDLSASLHSDSSCGSSLDWTGDAYVLGLGGIQTFE